MFALELSPTGSLFDDSPDAASSPAGLALTRELLDALRNSDSSPTMERFAPAWSELLARAVEEPGLICDAYTRFHGYSLGNRFAALIQCEMRGLEPGPLNSFGGWRKLGYAIKEGEKALTLCMPLKGTLHREKTDSKTQKSGPNEGGHPDVEEVEYIRAFVWKPSWFVLSQTVPVSENAEALPVPAPLAWDGAKALATLDIAQVPFDLLDGNALGFARKREIAVSPLSPYQFKTLFHELAHVVLGHTTDNFRGEGNTGLELSDGPQLSPALIEVEAESVALLLLATLDLPGQEFCRGYIQHWLQGPNGRAQDIPEKSAQRIFGAADRILCAGAGEARHRAPTAEEVGLNGPVSKSLSDGATALPAPTPPSTRTSEKAGLPVSEAGLPPPELPATATATPDSSKWDNSQRLRAAQRANPSESAGQRPETVIAPELETPPQGLHSLTTGQKHRDRPEATPPSETDAWALYGHLQQVHRELHPDHIHRSARFASALRHVRGRDPGAAREVQTLVKSASRQLRTAFQLIEIVLDSPEIPGVEEFDPFEDMSPGEVRHSEMRHTASLEAPSEATPPIAIAETPSLSPTRQAAARRLVGRTLRSELQAEKDRFTQAAKRRELPVGRGSEKAMLSAMAAYLEVPLTSRRDLSSHQWARCASAIETEDLRWEKSKP